MLKQRIDNQPCVCLGLLLFIALITTSAWANPAATQGQVQTDASLTALIYDVSEPFSDIASARLDGLLKRIGDARVVLLGEASHGTAEFYEMRAHITKALVENKGFTLVAAEADWPDASRINDYIHAIDNSNGKNKVFSSFPQWMWANHSVVAFTRWLRAHNRSLASGASPVNFYGLDLYNIHGSMQAVLNYLHAIDPETAEHAYQHYRCLMHWARDPSSYSHGLKARRYRSCDKQAAAVLQAMLEKKALYQPLNSARYFNALQNAQLVKNGEKYYRSMSGSSTNSWNQRDQSMFETLQAVLNHHGKTAKAVVWAHNSHIDDARATEMKKHGQFNLGQLLREAMGDSVYLIGFGTDHGTVTAADYWGGPMKVMRIPPAHKDSYEGLFNTVKTDNFLLPLRHTHARKPNQDIVRNKLLAERQQRAIGTTYDPKDELKKHYFYGSLPRQYDEYIWFNETRAVKPLSQR